MATNKFFGAIGSIGGISGDLDNIDGGNLIEADGAILINDDRTGGLYSLDATSSLGEKSPSTIVPDSNPGTKEWILLKSLAAGFKLYESDSTNLFDISMSGGDVVIDNTYDTGVITFRGENTGNVNMLVLNSASGISGYHNNIKVFQTVTNGIDVGDGTNNPLRLISTGGIATIRNQHVSGHVYLQGRNAADTASHEILIGDPDGPVHLYYNDNLKIATSNTGVTITGILVSDGLTMGDNEDITLGVGPDAKLSSNGTAFVIENGAGNETMLKATQNGGVELYYNNLLAVKSTAYGIEVSDTSGTAAVVDFLDSSANTLSL